MKVYTDAVKEIVQNSYTALESLSYDKAIQIEPLEECIDEINQTHVVKDILDHAKLTDRHKQILKQQSVKEQDVITTKK